MEQTTGMQPDRIAGTTREPVVSAIPELSILGDKVRDATSLKRGLEEEERSNAAKQDDALGFADDLLNHAQATLTSGKAFGPTSGSFVREATSVADLVFDRVEAQIGISG